MHTTKEKNDAIDYVIMYNFCPPKPYHKEDREKLFINTSKQPMINIFLKNFFRKKADAQ